MNSDLNFNVKYIGTNYSELIISADILEYVKKYSDKKISLIKRLRELTLSFPFRQGLLESKQIIEYLIDFKYTQDELNDPTKKIGNNIYRQFIMSNNELYFRFVYIQPKGDTFGITLEEYFRNKMNFGVQFEYNSELKVFKLFNKDNSLKNLSNLTDEQFDEFVDSFGGSECLKHGIKQFVKLLNDETNDLFSVAFSEWANVYEFEDCNDSVNVKSDYRKSYVWFYYS